MRYLQLTCLICFVFSLVSGLPYGNGTAFATEKGIADRCGGISLEEAAAILGQSPDDLMKSSNNGLVSPDDIRKKTYKVPPYTCRIKSRSDYLKSINYSISIYNDPDQARNVFDTLLSNFKVIANVEAVPGLGDQTFLASNPHLDRMISLKGGVLIDVLTPADHTLQKRVVELVLRAF